MNVEMLYADSVLPEEKAMDELKGSFLNSKKLQGLCGVQVYQGVKLRDASLLSDEYLKEFYESFLISPKPSQSPQGAGRDENVFEFLARAAMKINVEE
eukprot:754148-Hanusia_phi.AAC.2